MRIGEHSWFQRLSFYLGTLDLLILKAVSLGAEHGYGVLLRIEHITGNALNIEQGALYPPCIALNIGGCSTPSGARPTTTARPSSIVSLPPAESA